MAIQQSQFPEIQIQSLVRGTIEKMPYYLFSNYSLVRSYPKFLMNEKQFIAILQYFWTLYPDAKLNWEQNFESEY